MTDHSSTQAAAQPRRVRRSAVLAWGGCAAICVAALAEIVDGLAHPPQDPGGLLVARFAAWGLLPIVFAVPAALIVARHPRNRIGWILMIPAIALVTGTPMDNYFSALAAAPPPTLLLLVTVWFQGWSWMLLILPLPLRRRVWQLDVTHTSQRFLEEAVAAFEAEGGAAYRVVNGSMQPVHVTGQWHDEEKLAARVDCGGPGSPTSRWPEGAGAGTMRTRTARRWSRPRRRCRGRSRKTAGVLEQPR